MLDKGEVVERGNHRELVAQNGLYAGLLNDSIEQTKGEQKAAS
ncbi:hypothetical protein JCM19239_187 [Vibrio variabilis]|uniref:Uncharacterized protein n=1 Tax=Vibrio variabilis TaxID=990271 RepID=A0ABQ0JD42_9VIBR|nr:hypothetical protein JCM19239_187 [Vibrio variabilis]